MAYRLVVKESKLPIGEVSADQLQTLVHLLEEEDSQDRDYYIDQDVLDYLADRGADPALLAILRDVIPPAGGLEVEWTEA
jgi:hypothetical protein